MLSWAKAPETVVIVTHAATLWDAKITERTGITTAIELGHTHHFPVLHLYRPDEPHSGDIYPFMDCKRDHCIKSNNGEFSGKIKSSHVIAVGGHWGQCLDQTLDSLMTIWSQKQGENLTLTLFEDGIYVWDIFFRTTDPYYTDIKHQINEQVINTPHGSDSFTYSKLSLAEVLGIIKKYEKPFSYELRAEFLKRKLPRYYRLNRSYHVVLRINHEYEEVIQTGNGENAPTLFIDYM